LRIGSYQSKPRERPTIRFKGGPASFLKGSSEALSRVATVGDLPLRNPYYSLAGLRTNQEYGAP